MRFITNRLGAVRGPSLAGKAGTVIERSHYNTGPTVLFDGNKSPNVLG
jgi:hypothetical protein